MSNAISRESMRIIADEILDAINESKGNRKEIVYAIEDILLGEGILDDVFLDGDKDGNYLVCDPDGILVARFKNKKDAETYRLMYGDSDWSVKEVV